MLSAGSVGEHFDDRQKEYWLMMAIVLCVVAFVACYLAGKRSLGQGLIALLTVGYFYGILRANLLTTFSHFIFDAGLIGIYLSQKWTSSDPRDAKRLEIVQFWTVLLIAWPFFVALMPFQPLLVSLVGLRGNVFFIPVLLLGAQLREKDLLQLSVGLAALNILALSFAVAEYFMGVPRFFPVSAVTRIIYASGDVAGGFFRIPSIFTSAHAYGGTMVGSMPYLIGSWERAHTRKFRLLSLVGMVAALFGILMSATRQNFILGSAMIVVTIFSSRMMASNRILFLLLIAAVGAAALSNERFQRFKTLGDTDAVAERIAGSVNRGFLEILTEYPMGNGLGGGGTSIPYFLEGQVKNPIGMENGYTLILAEQGIIGLVLWIAFIIWFFSRAGNAFAKGAWANSRRMAWCFAAVCLGTAWVGTGTFTSIPGTVVLLLGLGWTATPMLAERTESKRVRSGRSILPELQYKPV
jgi:hypothetical protein